MARVRYIQNLDFVIEDHGLAEYFRKLTSFSLNGFVNLGDVLNSIDLPYKVQKQYLISLREMMLVYDFYDEDIYCNHMVACNASEPDEVYDLDTIEEFLKDNHFINNGIELYYFKTCPVCGEGTGINDLVQKYPQSVQIRKLA